MSYARFGWGGSDVYIFLNVGGYLDCCGCLLQECEWVDDDTRPIPKGYLKPVGEIIQSEFKTTDDLLAHLEQHRAAGQFVPEDTVADLLEDRIENDHWIATYDAQTREGHSWPECGCEIGQAA